MLDFAAGHECMHEQPQAKLGNLSKCFLFCDYSLVQSVTGEAYLGGDPLLHACNLMQFEQVSSVKIV